MKILNHVDKFYDLTEEERIELVGTVFKAEGKDTLYFPLQLAEGEFNYGIRQGIIFLTSVSKYKTWGIGVYSPDDLDMDLCFDDVSIRQDVIEYVKSINKNNVTYRGILKKIQKRFNTGVIHE